jgi:energy-coupling factor transporter ATP-binding protein EcfA2
MAAKAPLKFLRIKQFRGSTQDFSINFESNKSLTLIYGENGSGKTTICDAFDFLGNGKVGSLENRGLGQIHPYWPTIGKSSADILVELMVDGTTWKAQANTKSVALTPATSPPPKIEVLRRSSILRLVQDAPKEKYDALRPFIDISLVEQAETALRTQIKESRGVQNDAASRIGENQDTLERLRKESMSTEQNALKWAAEILRSPPVDPTNAVKSLRDAVTALEALTTLTDLMDVAVQEENAALVALKTANAALMTAEDESMSGDADFERILFAARDHFSQHAVGAVCPLCESAERVDDLATRVSDRLTKLKTLSGARNAVSVAKAAHKSKLSAIVNFQNTATTLAATAAEKVGKAPTEWAENHKDALDALPGIQQDGVQAKVDVAKIKAACEAANQHCSKLERKSTWYATVKTVYEQYQTNFDSQEIISKLLPKLEKALEICEHKRKAFLDAILSAIAQEVGRLYELIHPGEGLNKITLKLDPKKTGSLDLATQFLSNQDQPPHAYFSESHLDSLGLCIFLALAALKDPQLTVVVMDDVLGSIDEPHVDRLIGMLYIESQKFKHTIITTHYQPWREKFRWGWLKNGQCELIELGPWNATNGIASAQSSQAPLYELRKHISATPPALQSACASAGVLLEAICDYLTAQYECDVPRRKGKLNLGDMLPKVVKGKLADSLRVDVRQTDGTYITTTLGDKLIQLRDMAQLRNIFGCHYNDLAHILPQQDAITFANLVHVVGSALICDEEGWPGSDKSGEYWATKGETRRLYPLKKPQ